MSYRVARAFERIPQITGMELTRHGNKWHGGYYLNGDRHQWRRDKLKVVLWRNGIWLFEEGGEGMSIENWLQRYGGAQDYWSAIRIIEGESVGFKWDKVRFEKKSGLYVSPDVLIGAKAYDLSLSPLFRHMCSMFPEEKVRKVWDEYNVTANFSGGTVFWYVNQSGKICHDKICWYGEDGHRIKTKPMGRQYRIGDGYTENPMFGSHLEGEVRGILESEKSCLYASCYYGGVWLGTGGKGNLRDPGSIPLYPDRDAEEAWGQVGDCVDWYSDWPECGEHSDLGDKIEWICASGK